MSKQGYLYPLTSSLGAEHRQAKEPEDRSPPSREDGLSLKLLSKVHGAKYKYLYLLYVLITFFFIKEMNFKMIPLAVLD